jgi:hypothetical protein
MIADFSTFRSRTDWYDRIWHIHNFQPEWMI